MEKSYKDIEGEIRKDTYRDNFFRIIEGDIERIISPYKNKFINVACPNCNNKKIKEEYVKGQFSFYLCSVCGTLFVNPRPPRDLLDLFYKKSKAIEASVISLIENERGRRKHIFVPRARLILKFLKEMGKAKGRLLEVGCGTGTLLEILKDTSGFSVEGLDPSDKAFAITMAKGLNVHKDTLEKFKSPTVKYDIVLSFETIEHVFSPYLFLRKINGLLKTGGYIIFTTPNYHGFDMMVLGKYYKNIHAPSHLNYFNIDTVHILLDRTGFAIRKKMTPGILDVGIVRKQIDHGVAPEVPPVIKYFMFDISKEAQYNLQRFLRNNCLSGNMMIFAEKIRSK